MRKIFLTTLIVICCSIMLGQSQAVHFSGTNSSIDVGNSVGNGLRTIECWFRPSVNISSSITDPAYSLVVRNDVQSNEFGLYIIGNDWTVNKGKLAFYVRYNGAINQIHSNLDTWSANTWYHVSGTIDPVDGMKLYINGIAQTETKASFKNATTNQIQVTKIGTWGDGNVRYFKGDIDEVRFWDRALSQTEIQTKQCTVLNPSNETGLVGYWRFEEGSGTLTNEVINNQNNTLTSGVSWVISNNCLSPSISIVSNDNDNIICNGTPITFNATVTNAGSSPIYQWQINGVNVGNNQSSFTTTNLQNNDIVTCIINPGANQTVSNAITISIAQSPIVNVTKNAWNGTCIGNSIWVCANSEQSSTYLWSNGITTDCFNANNAGIYTCTVTNSIGCQASGTVEVIYDPLPDQTINYPNHVSLCANKSDSVYVINPSPNQTYQWFTYDVTGTAHVISGETTPKIKIGNGSNINALGNTSLIVYITNTLTNCYSTNWINVFINPQPNITISASTPTLVCKGTNVTLTGTGGNGWNAYSWNNGAIGQSINVTPQSNTTYVLTGTDANGCSNSANISIQTSTICATIQSSYCNKTINNLLGNSMFATPILGATSYVFYFTDINTGATITHPSQLYYTSLMSVQGLQYNTSYYVQVQAIIGNITGPISPISCVLNIQQPTATIASNYCSKTINNLLGNSMFSTQVGNATSYVFYFTDINTGATITHPSPLYYTSLMSVQGIQYNTSYYVQVQAIVGNIAGPISPISCILNIQQPTAAIASNYCSKTINNLLGNSMFSTQVGNATSYVFYFTDIFTGATITHTSQLYYTSLMSVQGIQYNTSYYVQVQAIVGNITGPISPISCVLNIQQPTAVIASNYCNRTFNGITGNSMFANQVGNVTSYVFYFTNVNNSTNILSYTSSTYHMSLASIPAPGLQNNSSYYVTVQAIAGNITGPVSPQTCILTIGSGARVGNFEPIEESILSNETLNIYPNPSNKQINITLPENDFAHISIMDTQGKLVKEEFAQDYTTKIDLEHLSEGIYFIHIIQNGKTYREKIIKN